VELVLQAGEMAGHSDTLLKALIRKLKAGANVTPKYNFHCPALITSSRVCIDRHMSGPYMVRDDQPPLRVQAAFHINARPRRGEQRVRAHPGDLLGPVLLMPPAIRRQRQVMLLYVCISNGQVLSSVLIGRFHPSRNQPVQLCTKSARDR
jgi:hypothetical protein